MYAVAESIHAGHGASTLIVVRKAHSQWEERERDSETRHYFLDLSFWHYALLHRGQCTGPAFIPPSEKEKESS